MLWSLWQCSPRGRATTTWTTLPEVAGLARTGSAAFTEAIVGLLMVVIGLTLSGATYVIRRAESNDAVVGSTPCLGSDRSSGSC